MDWLRPESSFLPWVLLAIFGSLMVSYTTERFKGAFYEDAYRVIEPLRLYLAREMSGFS